MLNRVFKLTGRFDNVEGCTVRMIERAGDWLVEIRPKRSRRAYTVLLSSLVRYGILQAAKAGMLDSTAEVKKALDSLLDRHYG